MIKVHNVHAQGMSTVSKINGSQNWAVFFSLHQDPLGAAGASWVLNAKVHTNDQQDRGAAFFLACCSLAVACQSPGGRPRKKAHVHVDSKQDKGHQSFPSVQPFPRCKAAWVGRRHRLPFWLHRPRVSPLPAQLACRLTPSHPRKRGFLSGSDQDLALHTEQPAASNELESFVARNGRFRCRFRCRFQAILCDAGSMGTAAKQSHP